MGFLRDQLRTTPRAGSGWPLSSAPPRSAATDHAGLAGPAPLARGASERKRSLPTSHLPTPALRPIARRFSSAASKGLARCSRTRGATGRWQTRLGHFAAGDGVDLPIQFKHAKVLHAIYTSAITATARRVTVPLLWDKETGQIVNNESRNHPDVQNSASMTSALSWRTTTPRISWRD